MTFYYISIILVILSNVMYHLFQKSIPSSANPFASLIVTYSVAIIVSAIILFINPTKENFQEAFKGINWASFALGLSVVGLEVGFLLAYRSGWDISLAGIFANVIVAVLLIPIGLILFKEHLSLINAFGIALSIAGIILIAQK